MTKTKSNYSKEFCELVEKVNQEGNKFFGQYIGIGNPNAKILIVGKEPAISPEKTAQYKNEIFGNAKLWNDNVEKDICQQDVVNYFDSGEANALYPYKGQKFMIDKNGNGGTSRTWYNYQKIINHIRTGQFNGTLIDFHECCFSTDFSTATAKYSNLANKDEREQSIRIRKELLKDSFFQSFPIVIVGAGYYPREHGIDLQEIFNVKWIGDTKSVECCRSWLNIHYSSTETPKLLIHTNQLSVVSNNLIGDIAKICCDFLTENNISLYSLARREATLTDAHTNTTIPRWK